MADYYCQPKAYTYATTPTWGQAQDGDGRASGLATSATLVLDLTGASAVNGNTFTVMGATLTCVTSGAGTNQFNAASGSTLAANIATAINNATAATTAQGTAGALVGTFQLRYVVYARQNGNNLEIMTRAGSASYNSSTATHSGMTGMPAGAPWSFSGGASGAWGWLLSDTNDMSTIFGGSAYAYGVMKIGTAALVAGAVTSISDTIHIRANNKEHWYDRNQATGGTIQNARVAIFLVDDGTVWNGDTGTFTITIDPDFYNLGLCLPAQDVSSTTVWAARTLGKFIVRADTSSTNSTITISGVSSNFTGVLKNVQFVDNASGSGTMVFCNAAGVNHSTTFEGCKFVFKQNRFYTPFSGLFQYSPGSVVVTNCEFQWESFAGTCGALASAYNGDYFNRTQFIFDSCTATFSSAPAVRPLPFSIPIGMVTNNNALWTASNLRGFSIGSSGLSFLGGITAGGPREMTTVMLQNCSEDRDFRYESSAILVDWIAGQSYPVADSYLPNGTAWSYRFQWSASTDAIKPHQPVQVIKLTKTNILADGALSVALELFVRDAYDHLITDSHLFITVAYKDATSATQKTQSTWLPWGSTALASSAKSWSPSSFSGNAYVARKIALTTSTSVDQNTEIEVTLWVANPAPSALQDIFINPELTISAA